MESHENRTAKFFEFSKGERIICLRPLPWKSFYDWMINTAYPGFPKEGGSFARIRRELALDPPLMLAGWTFTSDMDKNIRFRSHIDWSVENKIFDLAEKHLFSVEISDFCRWDTALQRYL
tara:strand:+ start:181 stop:540 length:360 start_codon:yes stop_codon:yes gene_type:complete